MWLSEMRSSWVISLCKVLVGCLGGVGFSVVSAVAGRRPPNGKLWQQQLYGDTETTVWGLTCALLEWLMAMHFLLCRGPMKI